MNESDRYPSRRKFCRGILLGLSAGSVALSEAEEARSGASNDERQSRSVCAGAAKSSPKEGPAAQGILQLRLRTHRLAELRAFYHGKFQFPIQEETGDSITFQAGTTSLTFVQTAKQVDRPFYHFAFNIPENKLPKAKEWLSARTPLAADGRVYHFPNWNAHAIYFWDPAGNLGELIARHDLPNARGGAFTSEDILYASEIGLVVKDVPAAVQSLRARLALPAYRARSDTFATLGDEHRLLIVVQEGRPWMTRASAIYPTSAILQGTSAGPCDLAGHPYSVQIRPR